MGHNNKVLVLFKSCFFSATQGRYILGLEKAFWPGRTQRVEREGFTFYLDGAHTRKSIEVTKLSLYIGRILLLF